MTSAGSYILYKEFKDWLRADVIDLVDDISKFQMLTTQTNYIAITTPSTLTKGHSLEVFEKIRMDSNSFVILPSYVSLNSVSVSPGKPTITSVVIETSLIFSLRSLTIFSYSSAVYLLFILLSTLVHPL